MVLPAIYELAGRGLLPESWALIGADRGQMTDEDFRAHVHTALSEFGPQPEPASWARFAPRLRCAGGGFDTTDPGRLLDVLAEARRSVGGTPQLVHYLAVPPSAFVPLTRALAGVVYEKPYGTSTDSFRALDDLVLSVFDEDQVFRIDHFLGKEGTQDLHVLRFANRLFARNWSREHIAQVQIDVPEELDVAHGAAFYDATGAAL